MVVVMRMVEILSPENSHGVNTTIWLTARIQFVKHKCAAWKMFAKWASGTCRTLFLKFANLLLKDYHH